MSLQITRYVEDGVEVIAPEGFIDMSTAPQLRAALVEAVQPECRVTLDLDSVDFFDSTGLGVIVGGFKRAHESGASINIVCTHMQILNFFRIVGLMKSLNVQPSISDAVRAHHNFSGW